MKKTFLAFLAAGSLASFAQTTPTTTPTTTTPTTTSPTTTTPTTTTSPTTSTTTTTPTTQTSTSIDPVNSTVNGQLSTNSVNYWTPTAAPSWGWNSYGLWNTNAYPTTTTSANNTNGINSTTNMNSTSISGPATINASTNNGTWNNGNMNNASTNNSAMSNTSTNNGTLNNGSMNNGTMNNGTMNNGSMTSSNDYSAYGTSVSGLPPNVQNSFSKEYPANANNTYSWNQYGDWFYTHYTDKGRTTTYYYDTRGNGYTLALPVIQTYVPEEIIDKAVQKYGSSLYSIGMVKTHDGDAYSIGLIDKGQLRMEYLKEDGSSIANIWRAEEQTMSNTDANAGMDSQNSLNNANMTTTDAGKEQGKEAKKTWKGKGKNAKTKSGDARLKSKQKNIAN